MIKINKPCCRPLAIGSFPYKTPKEALERILTFFPETPLWPQLPQAHPWEQMYIQYYEGMPGITIDDAKMKLISREPDDLFFEETAEALTHIMEENFDPFAISPDKARGLHYFLSHAKEVIKTNPLWIKGQITGPVSFALSVTDNCMKPILYNETYKDLTVNLLWAKAAWQIERLKKIHDRVIMFIDEPYLAGTGSSMVALSKEDAVHMLKTITDNIRSKGALSGIHCCGNTDWTILFDARCDIISMDAYQYSDNFLLYMDNISAHFSGGGFIAWGIVPTSSDIYNTTPQGLLSKMEAVFERLQAQGVSRKTLLENSFISPSCGLGNLDPAAAEEVMKQCCALSGMLIKQI